MGRRGRGARGSATRLGPRQQVTPISDAAGRHSAHSPFDRFADVGRETFTSAMVEKPRAALPTKAHVFGGLFTASAKLAFADPGCSGFCWLSCGAQPDSQITSKVARMRPS